MDQFGAISKALINKEHKRHESNIDRLLNHQGVNKSTLQNTRSNSQTSLKSVKNE
jgi:hypothetical protein